MDWKASASLYTAAMAQSPKALPIAAIKAPLSPSTSAASPSSSSSSLPIRAPPSTDDGFDEENGVEKQSKASSIGSDSDAFLSDGEDEFETASERPFVADPDEEALEIPAAEEDFPLPPKEGMPIAQVSVDDDDDGVVEVVDEWLVRYVDGDGFSGVVRVPPQSLLDELEGDGGENPILVGGTGFKVLDGEGKDTLVEEDSSLAVPEADENDVHEKDKAGNPSSVESLGDKVLDGGEKDEPWGRNSAEYSFAVAEETVESGFGVSEGQMILENPIMEDNLSSATVEKSDVRLIDAGGGSTPEEKTTVDGNSAVEDDLVANTESGTLEIQEADSAVEKTVIFGNGSDELNPVIEMRNDDLGNIIFSCNECVTIPAAADGLVEFVECPEVLDSNPSSTYLEVESNELVDSKKNENSEIQVTEIEEEKIAVLGSKSDQASPLYGEAADSRNGGAVSSVIGESSVPNELLPYPAADREISMADNCKTFPADRNQFEPGEVGHGRYASQTASFIDESVENNLSKEVESQTIAADSAKNVEMNKEILASPVILGGVLSSSIISEPEISMEDLSPNPVSDPDVNRCYDSQSIEDEAKYDDSEFGDLTREEHAQGSFLGASKTTEEIIREVGHGSSSSQSDFESSRETSQNIDGQIMTDSDEEVDTDEEADGKELYDSAALAALLREASSAGLDGSVSITARDASQLFSVERPAGLGSNVPSLKPAPSRSNQSNIFTPSHLAVVGESDGNMDDEEKKLQEKIQGIRVKFLRLIHRLGHSPEDTVAAQVLYRLGLAEGIRRGRQTNRTFSFESARKTALQIEAAGIDDLDFSCNVLILGKAGVGKSATINSIFGEEKTTVSAFEPSTTTVKEIIGTVDGINIRVIDTPGLKSSVMDQSLNRRILLSIKKLTNKCPPDIVLYIDRLDTQTRDFNDLPLLRTISTTLGPSIWLNAIVALTHAASAPPDGPNGSPLSYDMLVTQRSHVIQHSIRQAAGDMRLMNPVALVENHPSCRRNREGQSVLPNGQNWRPQLLLLCYSSKILSEANSLLKLQDQSAGKLFGFRVHSPPLPYLLSSLLQSRAHPKVSTEMGGDSVDSDIDLDDLSDSDPGEEEEYDQLPPFKPLNKSQIASLSKEQRKAYFDEYDYRVKLLQKKQWREELHRLKESRKRGKEGGNDIGYGDLGSENYDQENGNPAAVPVPLPDMVLPPSFDGDNPAYRYRFLEPTSQLLVRPVLDTHGWDHDCGYDGVSLEESLAIAKQFPAIVAVQITKDKREFNIHLDSSISAKHGENGSTLAGFDIQSVGKQLAYSLRSETKFKNLKKNKSAAGISVTFLGENVATGLKVEDQISIGKRVRLVASSGAVRSQGDLAYGANLEARLKEKEYPIGQDQSTLGLSLMKWRGDLALGANLQSQFSVGRNSKVAVRFGLNNKLSGQITIQASSSEQLQIALVGIIPVAIAIFRTIWSSESYPSR